MAGRRAEAAEGFTRIAPLLAFLLPLLVYAFTLARDVTWVDSGELAAAGAHLGIAHPPGYPLYLLLAHLFAQLPVGAVSLRIALLSAVSTAAATALLYSTAWKVAAGAVGSSGRRWPAALATLSGALLYAFARTPWSQAVIVEVYALHGALLAALLCMGWRVAGGPGEGAPVHRLLMLGVLFGLGLTHHLTAALNVFALVAVLILYARGRRHDGPADGPARLRGWWLAGAGTVPPLLLYLYLPIRSQMNPRVAWDYPDTWHRFWVHVSARQYHGLWGRDGLSLAELRRFVAEQLPAEATPALWILALVGVAALWRRQPRALWLTIPLLLAYTLYNLGYPIPDIEVYYVPVILILAFWAAAGAGLVTARVQRWNALAMWPVVLITVSLPAVAAVRNFPHNDMSRFRVASTYVKDVAEAAQEGGLIFSDSWAQFSAPMLYLQTVEGYRGDLVILDMASLSNPMLGRRLEGVLPELAAACREELSAVAELGRKAERGAAYNVEYGRGLYRNLLRALARESLRLRPVYALGAAFQHGMFQGLERHPEGLLVRLTEDPAYRPPASVRLRLPSLLVDRDLTDRDREILSAYLSMIDGRMRYALHHGQAAEADSMRRYLESIRR